MSHARRDAKGEKSSDYTIEEQVVLRVPPAIADAVRAILSGKERDLSFVMGMRPFIVLALTSVASVFTSY